jgi:hypothetical protein
VDCWQVGGEAEQRGGDGGAEGGGAIGGAEEVESNGEEAYTHEKEASRVAQ